MRDVAVRAVEPQALLAHRLNEKDMPVLPAAELPAGLELHRDLRERLAQAELLQRPHHVRRNDDPCADLAQPGRLLVDRCLEPGLAEEQRGGQAAQAAADNGDPHR